MFYKYLDRRLVLNFTSRSHAHIEAVRTLLNLSPDLVPATNDPPKAVVDELVGTVDPVIQTD